VTACIWLTSLFLRWLGGAVATPHTPSSAVVNVSSLAAIQPFSTMLVYCAGKAARDMLHKGVAEEASLATAAGTMPAVKSLNYAPGPMDTDMQGELASSATLLAESRAYFASLKAEGKLVMPDDSAAKCARLLAADTFVSGSHVDFYDSES
jgi:sepiapterin reductase